MWVKSGSPVQGIIKVSTEPFGAFFIARVRGSNSDTLPIGSAMRSETAQTTSTVSMALNRSHRVGNVQIAVTNLLRTLRPPLPKLVRRGDSVFLKVNMGCSGVRSPEQRFTSHPVLVQAIIEALKDCGAVVSFGDDVSRNGRHSEQICRAAGMLDVAKRTGATLVDFVAVGVREIRGGLVYPRTYLITNAFFEADKVINLANCRSHVAIGLSGGIKNMFGCVVGLRKQAIHNLNPGDTDRFGRTIADIYRVARPDLSFLDLTSVVEGVGNNPAVRPVGLMLASTDGVALDTVAAHAIGYEELPIPTTLHAHRFGLGCNRMDQIQIRGADWDAFDRKHLRHSYMGHVRASFYDRVSAILNNTILRPRPVIRHDTCKRCAACVERCPVKCITIGHQEITIDLARCVDCGCCLRVCDNGAVQLEFVGVARAIRRAVNKLPCAVDPKAPNRLDVARTPRQ